MPHRFFDDIRPWLMESVPQHHGIGGTTGVSPPSIVAAVDVLPHNTAAAADASPPSTVAAAEHEASRAPTVAAAEASPPHSVGDAEAPPPPTPNAVDALPPPIVYPKQAQLHYIPLPRKTHVRRRQIVGSNWSPRRL